ncbi:THAP domain-containing protein 2-like [Xenia sp. Carnegie-2017]|uniref:THAP domain-containing protein 2-like n=1 Tax=Xenia sp. Carnegie-2017 TaxID=2897299 RepID=UPI001F049B18|nr:THAP domain-containing protein 2-like [Xenia sp. Carnegie-2017]
MKRKNFTPNASSFLCSDHFLHVDYNTENAYKRKLKLDAIPSVFAFPERLLSKKSKRKPPARRETETSSPSAKKARIDLLEESLIEETIPMQNAVASSPRKKKLRRKIKTLKQKLRRKETKIQSLSSLVKKLEKEKFISSDAASILDNNFSGVGGEILKSDLKNKNRAATGRRYSDEVKKKARNNPEYRDCALLFDGMYIKSGVVYNRSKGNYEGFVNFGADVVAFDPDKVATEALVFMLVGLRGHWKCPIGYVLCSGINSSNLSALVSKLFRLASSHGLNMYSVTCDGTATNFYCMKALGCEFGSNLSDIKYS